MDEAFLRLRGEVRAAGFDSRPTGRVLLELCGHLSLVAVGAGLFFGTPWLALRLAGLLVAAAGAAGVGTNSHTASHNAASHKPWVNALLTYFGYPFFLQLSATRWHETHVVIHHTSPNVAGVDTDSDLMPWLALHHYDVEGRSRLARLYYRHQVWLMPLLVPFDGPLRQLTGLRYVVRALFDRSRRRRAHWIDLGCLLAHYAFWLALPMCFFPPLAVLAFHYGRLLLLGYFLFAILGPAHYVAEAIAVPASDKTPQTFVLLQSATTVNFTTRGYARYLVSGLGYQIEHHLFPNICHVHLPALSNLVRSFCEREGYPYRAVTWGEALGMTVAAFRATKPVVPLSTARAAVR